jgi:hypothetical protein
MILSLYPFSDITLLQSLLFLLLFVNVHSFWARWQRATDQIVARQQAVQELQSFLSSSLLFSLRPFIDLLLCKDPVAISISFRQLDIIDFALRLSLFANLTEHLRGSTAAGDVYPNYDEDQNNSASADEKANSFSTVV